MVVGFHDIHLAGRLGYRRLHVFPFKGGHAVVLGVASGKIVKLAIGNLHDNGAVVLFRTFVGIAYTGRVGHRNLAQRREGRGGRGCGSAIPDFSVYRNVLYRKGRIISGFLFEDNLAAGAGLELLGLEPLVGYMPFDGSDIILAIRGVAGLGGHIEGIVVRRIAAVQQQSHGEGVQHFRETLQHVGGGERGNRFVPVHAVPPAEMVVVEMGQNGIIEGGIAGPGHAAVDIVC